MKGKRKYKTPHFVDHFLVYPSEHEDGKFVAHSLRTGQVGVATCVEEAIYSLFKAILNLLDEINSDENVAWQKAAPPEICHKFAETMNTVPSGLINRALNRCRQDRANWEPYIGADEPDEDQIGGSWRDEDGSGDQVDAHEVSWGVMGMNDLAELAHS